MNWRKFLFVLVLAIAAVILFDYLYNFILLQRAFVQNSQYWRTPGEMRALVPVGWLFMLLATTLVGVIFARFGKNGIRNGLELGFLTGFAFFVLIFGFTTIVPWPVGLLAAWAGQWFFNSLILGFLFGWLYKGKNATSKISNST